MRYAILHISKERMEELLALTTKRVCFERVSDLPDDIHIDNITFDPITNRFMVLVSGSGAPLKKIPERGHIPEIFITLHEIKCDPK